MRPNKDRRTEIILYGLLLIPLLFTAAALAQATEQAQGLAEITAVLSEILHTPSMLRWCASTPKFLLAVLVFYPLAVYCYMLDQADRHPGAEHGTAKWGSAHRLNIKYRNTKDPKENYILTENVRFSTDSHAHKHKQGNLRKTGNLDIFCGYFGNGKTLSLVKQVVCREYKRYDGLTVWCNRRQKFVTQRILILSNVDLCVPYERLTGLAQVCAISKANEIYDDEHDTLTITIVCMDELSVQMNSRSFKDNINAYFLNTLMCCRHYHISFYGSAQRFQHVDKMLRDVTMNVVQCKKVWRFQFNSYYDGFQLENAQDPTLVRPLRRACWFVTDADYNAYDTLQVVDNLQKSFNENDMLTEAEILANQAAPAPVGMDAVTPSRKAKKIMREKVNR